MINIHTAKPKSKSQSRRKAIQTLSTNAFEKAMVARDTLTQNGMVTNSGTGSPLLDLFFDIGAMRTRTQEEKLNKFYAAYFTNKLLAMKMLFYSRDIRGGQGERQLFRDIISDLASNDPEVVLNNLGLIPEYGRWDDLLCLIGINPELDTAVEQTIFNGILAPRTAGLAAKWMPRKGPLADWLRNRWDMTPKMYRRFLVTRTEVVEQKMCANQWTDINYSHVPSIASKNYRKAFLKHDPDGYKAYLAALTKKDPSVKVNAEAIFPHDILKAYFISNYGMSVGSLDTFLEEQWKALPDWYSQSTERLLPVCDVSGSMSGLPIQVCAALGLYIAERNKGAFKDLCVTFSSDPAFIALRQKTLKDRINHLINSNWSMSTDLEAVFKLILKQATTNRVPQDEMPTMLVIISDMEFNHCVSKPSNTAMDMIEREYRAAGYQVPKIVFWKVNALTPKGNYPVQVNKDGTALVSGFSPSILKQLLSNPARFSPEGIMLETLNNPRYDLVTA
jgi:hypothetical protein